MQALAQIKQGDPPGALRTLEGLEPGSVPGRIAQALALSGAAVMGFADPQLGTVKAAECRRPAIESGDQTTLVAASRAQAAAAHARDDLRRSVWADLFDTHALRELAISVFDGHLCMTQRLLYGARCYPDVVSFADSFIAESQRLGAARGRAFATTLRVSRTSPTDVARVQLSPRRVPIAPNPAAPTSRRRPTMSDHATTIAAEDLFTGGDWVAVRFTLTGTHTGELFGAPAAGAHAEAEGITILRFSGDRVAERWDHLDDITFLAQIGAMAAAAGV